MKTCTAGLALVLASAATLAAAQPASPPQGAVNIPALQITDANSLVASCSSNQSDPQWGMRRLACAAYVAGAVDSIAGINDAGKGAKMFCTGPDASYGKVRDGVIQFVKENPAEGKVGAGLVIALLLPKLYPCSK